MAEEYTWEDYERFVIGLRSSSTDPNHWEFVRRREIEAYFKEHPEKLLEGGIFKKMGYSIDDVKKILNHEIPGPPLLF